MISTSIGKPAPLPHFEISSVWKNYGKYPVNEGMKVIVIQNVYFVQILV